MGNRLRLTVSRGHGSARQYRVDYGSWLIPGAVRLAERLPIKQFAFLSTLLGLAYLGYLSRGDRPLTIALGGLMTLALVAVLLDGRSTNGRKGKTGKDREKRNNSPP